MTAEELISWAHGFFWPRLCLTCSWQKQSSVLVHMVAELGLRMDTVELDTHLFFRESYDTRDRLVERYQLKLIQPSIPTVAEQHRAEGANLAWLPGLQALQRNRARVARDQAAPGRRPSIAPRVAAGSFSCDQ